jgi:prepilin signal peptidase PulO-like enzyme (type II secretory pathway)
MVLLLSFVLFVLGAIVASFVGVVVARLYTGQSFLVGRSRCDACGATLTSLALVPIVSYVAYGGRAHCCGARLSLLSPTTELLLGALFALSYSQLGFTTALPFMLLALALLMALVLYDLAHQILPTPLLTVFVLVSALTGFFLAPSPGAFYMSIFVALLIGGSLALIHFLSRGRAMGFADAPFAFGLSLMVGPTAFSGFIFSFWIGAVIGIVILLKRPRGSRIGVEVPFAPFLAAGFLLAYFTQWNPFILIANLAAFR